MESQEETNRQPENKDNSPLGLLKLSVEKLPELRYVYGIVALIAITTLIISFRLNFAFTVVAVIVLLLVTVLIYFFSELTKNSGDKGIKIIAFSFAWIVFIAFVVCLSLFISSIFFQFPMSRGDLKDLFGESKKNIQLKIALASRGAEAIEIVLKKYEKQKAEFYKGQNIKYSIVIDKAFYNEYKTARRDFKKGDYDIIMMDDPWTQEYFPYMEDMLKIKSKIPIDTTSLKEFLLPPLYDAFCIRVNNTSKLIGLPLTGNVHMILINKKIKELDTVMKHCKTRMPIDMPFPINETISCRDLIKKNGIEIPLWIRCDIPNSIVEIFFELLSKQDYSPEFNDDVLILDKEKCDSALKWLDIAVDGSVMTDINAERDVRRVVSGEYGMAFGWPNWVQAFLTHDEANNVRLMKVSNHPILGAWALGILKSSQNKTEALNLIQDICANQEWQDVLAIEGIVPVYRGFSNNHSILNSSLFWERNAGEIENALTNSISRPKTAKWEQIEDKLGKQIIQSLRERKNLLHNERELFSLN